jgi:hypothetical protein
MKKFVTLGTECVEYLKATRASEGNLLSYTFSCLECHSLLLYSNFFTLRLNYRCFGGS